jgi:class 3 adenylate cyclase/pimeloyl-ACP methyl ester carboxylesterase
MGRFWKSPTPGGTWKTLSVNEVSYALAGDTHIAYRLIGEPGAVDVVMVAGTFFPFEMLEEDRHSARFLGGLASLGRLTVFDKRGVGLSDPMTDWSRSAQEQWAEDLSAVIEAADLTRPVVVSWEPMGAARLAAARRPELFGSLVLINPSQFTSAMASLMSAAGDSNVPARSIEERAFPSRIGDPGFLDWLSRAGRSGASPASAGRMWGHVLGFDGSLTPPGIETPTLVLRNRDCMTDESTVQAVVDAIPAANLVHIPGADNYPISGDIDPLVAEITRFVTGGRSELAPQRLVSAVLFTDLVDSTRRAVEMGDEQWRGLLDVHDQAVQRSVLHHGGRVVKYTGDGVLALLPSATAALETARSIGEQLRERGLYIRAGVHVGDVDTRGDDVSGIAINATARIMSQAEADDTLVSESARQATFGSGLRFENVGSVDLKGIPEAFTLHRWVR